MSRVILLPAVCLALTTWLLAESRSVRPLMRSSAIRRLSFDELNTLHPGTVVGIERIQCDLPSITVGEVHHVDSHGVELTNVVRQKPPYLSMRYRLGYVGRLMRNAGLGIERLPQDWIPARDIQAAVIFPHFPPMNARTVRFP